MALSLQERMGLGAAGGICTTFVTHPFDVVRVQMQVPPGYSSTFAATRAIASSGIGNLYAGVSAAWLRQVTYGSARVGIYSYLLERSTQSREGVPPPFFEKLLMGTASGSIGAAIGSPAELAMVRMGADQTLPPEQRRNYRSSIDVCVRVAREEGVATLWRGVGPTVLRAAALSSTLLALTSEFKAATAQATGWDASSVPTMFVAISGASLFANAASLPFDVVKSRIQQSTTPGQYNGMIDCARRSLAAEGPLVLFKGFVPAFVKLAPYSIISLTLTEKFTKWYRPGSSGM